MVTEERRSDRLIDMNRVKELCGLSRATVYERVRDGSFPVPFKAGKRAIRWRESEIIDWADNLVRSRALPKED